MSTNLLLIYTDFNLEAYMDADNLSELQYVLGKVDFTKRINLLSKGATAKYQKLTAVLCEIIEDFALVSFTTLNIQDKQSIINLLYLIDKANGYSYSGRQTMIWSQSDSQALPRLLL